uniref:Uncharacterized protein n=1 Tax=Lepeophtheirus salmonis TaxID=72036 RepID=A0A0K2UAR7_LEPSM
MTSLLHQLEDTRMRRVSECVELNLTKDHVTLSRPALKNKSICNKEVA